MADRKCGTLAAYKAGCHCLPCRKASSDYEMRRHRLAAYGKPTTTLVDAEPVRLHIEYLRTRSMGRRRIAEVAGVPYEAVYRVLYDGGKGERVRRMKPERAAAILAVRPDPNPLMQVDATGTMRRLRALVALGWSQKYLAGRLGCNPTQFAAIVGGKQRKVQHRRVVAVRKLYDELWNVPPEGAPRVILRVKNQASRRGWALPAEWDDDLIDDPKAEPCREAGPRRPGPVRKVYLDDVEHLRGYHMSDADIARLLHVTPTYIREVARRAQEEQSAQPPEEAAS